MWYRKKPMWYRYFRCGIGKNRCGIGISDVVSEKTDVVSEFFRYVRFPIPHRKLFLTVYRIDEGTRNFHINSTKVTSSFIVSPILLIKIFSLVQKCMKNLPVHAYVTTSMLLLDVVDELRLSIFHDAGMQCYIKLEHNWVTKNTELLKAYPYFSITFDREVQLWRDFFLNAGY
jgi:hypothetical protein